VAKRKQKITPEMVRLLKLAVQKLEESWDAQRDLELEIGRDFDTLAFRVRLPATAPCGLNKKADKTKPLPEAEETNMPKVKEQEKDFQTQANDYAKIAISNIREMVEALEHAGECNGEMECTDCAGTGKADTAVNNEEEDCKTCKGAGTTECTEGKDSDEPESWHDEERARERIQEDALSVEVRSDWHTPGSDDIDTQDCEFAILLTTGGPAARIVGELDRYKQPCKARFEYQDWFKPWTEAYTDSADDAVMLRYAQQFYFGD
jgi:hypothetical protein